MKGGKTHPWSWIKRNWTGKMLIFYYSFFLLLLLLFLPPLLLPPAPRPETVLVVGRDELRHGKE
jgi:hypothetical protein